MILGGTLRGVGGMTVEITGSMVRERLPSFSIRGLADVAQRETRVRVQAALAGAGVALGGCVEVTCDARGCAIDGCALDLPIALALAGGAVGDVGAIGELSLAGEVRPVRGALAIVEALKARVGLVLVAPDNGAEAALVDDVRIAVVRNLKEALAVVRGLQEPTVAARRTSSVAVPRPDMRDVVGQSRARRALEIAAAGGHSIVLFGGPGTGKTMLARRLPGLMPAMTEDEAVDVTRVHSAAGLNIGGGLIEDRPFRAPHHSTTPPGLVGGGARSPRPGEITLAHHGVLFLDELPEFSRPALEVLDEPMASREVLLARASATLRFPANALVVASMSPCPCGRFGAPGGRRCTCCLDSRRRYLARLPERLLRRFDLRVGTDPLDIATIDASARGEDSATIRERVSGARALLSSTKKMTWEATCARSLATASDRAGIYERAVRVAQTIAALCGRGTVLPVDAEEAAELARDPSDLLCESPP